MPVPPKPKSPAVTDDVIRARRIMWVGWLDDCAAMQDLFVEGMLENLPKKDGKRG